MRRRTYTYSAARDLGFLLSQWLAPFALFRRFRFVRHRCSALPLLSVSDVFATSTTHTIGLLSLIIILGSTCRHTDRYGVSSTRSILIPVHPRCRPPSLPVTLFQFRFRSTHPSYSRPHHSQTQTRTHTPSPLRSRWLVGWLVVFFASVRIPRQRMDPPFVAIVDSAHPHIVVPRILALYTTRRCALGL